MKKSVGDRIRRIRQNQNIKRDHVADELEMSNSAYSKIERGETDVQVTRLEAIAKILKVNVVDFFLDKKEQLNLEDPSKNYGIATKIDIEELNLTIKQLRQEVEKLKSRLDEKKKVSSKRKK